MRRETVIAFCAKLPTCIIAMKACCGSHHMGGILAAHGHIVRLMPPEYVRRYVKAQKNDNRDAEASAEGICRKFRVRAITMEKKETSYGETEATGYFRRAA
jgi:transposase